MEGSSCEQVFVDFVAEVCLNKDRLKRLLLVDTAVVRADSKGSGEFYDPWFALESSMLSAAD